MCVCEHCYGYKIYSKVKPFFIRAFWPVSDLEVFFAVFLERLRNGSESSGKIWRLISPRRPVQSVDQLYSQSVKYSLILSLLKLRSKGANLSKNLPETCSLGSNHDNCREATPPHTHTKKNNLSYHHRSVCGQCQASLADVWWINSITIMER